MTIESFVDKWYMELHEHIKIRYGVHCRNESEIEDFISNDEDLYLWATNEGVEV